MTDLEMVKQVDTAIWELLQYLKQGKPATAEFMMHMWINLLLLGEM